MGVVVVVVVVMMMMMKMMMMMMMMMMKMMMTTTMMMVTVDGSIADAVTHLHACRLARVSDLIQLIEATAAK